MNTFLYDLKSIFFPSNFYLVGVAPGERPYDPEDWNYVSQTLSTPKLAGLRVNFLKILVSLLSCLFFFLVSFFWYFPHQVS